MTEQAQRIAIAIWMGLVPETRHPSPSGSWEFVENPLPDYTRDLNAMAEAEARLNGKQMVTYADTLNRTTPLGSWMIVATAAQRAEALLLTLGLWTDEKEGA